MPENGHFGFAASTVSSGPTRTPNDDTSWVSNGLVSIAISYPHAGQP